MSLMQRKVKLSGIKHDNKKNSFPYVHLKQNVNPTCDPAHDYRLDLLVLVGTPRMNE
jgi:hypothetical protein